MTGALMAEEMASQSAILSSIVQRSEGHRREVAAIVPRPLAGAAFVARGSSSNAALLGRYLVELASGRPATMIAPSVHTRYVADVDYSGFLVIALSQSGETPEIAAVAQALRHRGARVVAVTNAATSTLGDVAELTLPLEAGEERAVPATKTVTAQMLMMVILASALGDIGANGGGLREVPGAVEETLSDPGPAEMLAQRWAGRDRLLVVARGLLLASASEAALKVRETARLFAQSFSPADLLHGPVASVRAGDPVLVLDGGGPVRTDVTEIAKRLADASAEVATCGAGREQSLPLPSLLPEPLQAVVATVRGQQLAYSWARAVGYDPDFPEGLSKVTRTA